MGNWANRTSTMITITIFLLLLVATTGLYAGYTNFIVQEDARIINELGKIRWSAAPGTLCADGNELS